MPKSPAVLVTFTTDPVCGSGTLTAFADNSTMPLALSFFIITTSTTLDEPIRGELSGAGRNKRKERNEELCKNTKVQSSCQESIRSGEKANKNLKDREKQITDHKYLLLTEFEVNTVSYGPRIVTYSTDLENEVSKVFIISLGSKRHLAWRLKQTFEFSGPYSEYNPLN